MSAIAAIKRQKIPKVTRSNISDDVYTILKEMIFYGHLRPGERLSLREIAQEMGISRTPLKDAVNRLAVEGLIEIKPRSGTYVKTITRKDMQELFDVRRVLEEYAAELAIERMTESTLHKVRSLAQQMRTLADGQDTVPIFREYVDLDYRFHELILRSAGNQHLKELWDQVNVHVQIARVCYRSSESHRMWSTSEHEQIVDALGANDAVAVKQLMRTHIERAKEYLLNDLENELAALPE